MSESLLVEGNIPEGKECPFLKQCELWTTNCPTRVYDNLRKVPFSCGAARGFDICRED